MARRGRRGSNRDRRTVRTGEGGITFYVYNNQSSTFDPVTTTTREIPSWNLGDGSTINGTTVSYNYADNNQYQVKLGMRSISRITSLNLQNDNVTGSINFPLQSLSIFNLDVNNNSQLKGISNLTSSALQASNTWDLSGCDLTGEVDFSKVTWLNFPSNFFMDTNPNLTNVLFNNSAVNNTGTNLWINDCNLSTSLDLSMVNFTAGGNGTNVWLQGNPNLSTLLLGPGRLNDLYIYGCNFSGSLNLANNEIRRLYAYDMNITDFVISGSSTPYDLSLNGNGFTGSVDLSYITMSKQGSTSIVEFFNNSSEWSCIPPKNAPEGTLYYMQSSNYSGSYDMSNIDAISGLIISNNPNLTSLILTSVTNSVDAINFTVNNTGINSLDLTKMRFNTSSAVTLQMHSNVNLTSLVWGDSLHSRGRTNNMYGCDLGYVDFTPLSASFQLGAWPNEVIYIDIKDNNMTSAEVNHILVDIDSIAPSGSQSTRTLNIAGTNAPPDGTSGGFDGNAATGSLITKGWTVTTS